MIEIVAPCKAKILALFLSASCAYVTCSDTNSIAPTQFNWGNVVNLPNRVTPPPRGNQILHFNTSNKSVWLHKSTNDYIQSHLSRSKIFDSDAANLKYAVELAQTSSGFFLEFGVCTGKTINFIAALNPQATIHGFDSFTGLPEDWKPSCPKGTFGFKNPEQLPAVLPNIQLHVGIFQDSLPIFKREILKDSHIAFMHIDSDLYSSAQCIFDIMKNNISTGTIIVFDEYFNFDGWQEGHEFKAFQEFIAASGLSYEYLSFNQVHEQVTVRIC